MKDLLGLEYQLDAIDYSRPNFVHADMDLQTFEALQRDRGENLFTLMLKEILADMKRQAQGDTSGDINPFELMAALLSRDRSRSLKLLLARNFQDIEARTAGLEGENGTVILTERNKVAIEAVRKALDSGKRRLGVFFGGAHMKDLERRLGEMGFRRTAGRWLVAWDIPATGDARPRPEGTGIHGAPARRV